MGEYVTGADNYYGLFARYSSGLDSKNDKLNESDAQKIVALAQSRVPRDTGNLFNSIAYYHTTAGTWVVVVDARHSGSAEFDSYYGRFVELGTKPGRRERKSKVADDAYFADDGLTHRGRPRKYAPGKRERISYRTHPGTDPQPFFLNSAKEVLGGRFERAQQASAQAAKDAGWI